MEVGAGVRVGLGVGAWGVGVGIETSTGTGAAQAESVKMIKNRAAIRQTAETMRITTSFKAPSGKINSIYLIIAESRRYDKQEARDKSRAKK